MIDLSGPETLLAATAAVANRAIRRSSSGSVLPFDAPDESLRLPQSLAAASRDSSSRASPTPCCALVTKPLVTKPADSVPSGSYASASAYTRKLSLTLPYRSEMSSPKGRRSSQLSNPSPSPDPTPNPDPNPNPNPNPDPNPNPNPNPNSNPGRVSSQAGRR